MSTFEEQAASFFPSLVPAAAPAAPAAAPAQTDFEKAANTLFGDSTPKPAAPAKPRDEPTDDIDKAQAFFAGSPIHGDAERAIQSAMVEQLATPEEAQAVVAEWAPLMHEFELNSSESAQLTELGVSAALRPPSDETLAGWAEASRQAIRQEYGPRAGEALQAARQLIATNPKLKAFLEDTGLGNNPAYVRLACEKAMDLKKRGKL